MSHMQKLLRISPLNVVGFCFITVVVPGLFYRQGYKLTPDLSQFTFQTEQPDER